jgi:hypothetical protein
MDDLLAALILADEEKINDLACRRFITSCGGCDWEAIRKFEELSNCRIFPLEKDSFGWLIGGISFQGRIFSYG